MANFFSEFIRFLKLPVKILKGVFRKKRKRTKLKEKCRKHVWNFSAGRVKNRSWQRNLGKNKRKKSKKSKENLSNI